MDATLFVTCLADTFYPQAPRAAVRVLSRLGFDVHCPAGQTCCGQPMYNAGYSDHARSVARSFLAAFADTSGPIITPSSSCAAMVREHYPRLFSERPAELEQARLRVARELQRGRVHGGDEVKRLRNEFRRLTARIRELKGQSHPKPQATEPP